MVVGKQAAPVKYCRFTAVVLTTFAAVLPAFVKADMVAAIERIKQSVVIVGTYNETESPRFRLRGSGFVVGNGNWAITNAHVLPHKQDAISVPQNEVGTRLVVQIRAPSGALSQRQATILDIDPTHDLALLRFEGAAAPMLKVQSGPGPKEGQTVGLMGFPIGGALGFAPVTHRGMIASITTAALPSATGQQLDARTARTLRDNNFEVFQLDATAYPGNSGGPLFDVDSAEVLGVINMVFVKGTRESALTAPSGITYAIPAKFVSLILKKNTAE